MSARKVCLVSTSPVLGRLLMGMELDGVGGAEVQQTLIVKMLLDLGCDVTVLVHDFGQPDECDTEEGVHLLKAYRKGGGLASCAAFRRAMKRADADVYYQRGGGTMTGLIANACKSLGRPFIYATSSDIDLDGRKEQTMNPIGRAIFRYGIRNARIVLVQNQVQSANLKERFRREGVVIRNTFALPDIDDSVPRESVLWVGSFRALKRPDLFVELAARLPDRKFVMVGGPFKEHPELFGEMKGKAEGTPNIELTGLASPDKVGQYFDRAKILVCTSDVEGFPNTFLQAWCRGVPVVSTVDPDDLIRNLGLGCACNSPDEMVKAVDLLCSDDALREEMGRKAKEYVNSNHHPEVVHARYREVLDAL